MAQKAHDPRPVARRLQRGLRDELLPPFGEHPFAVFVGAEELFGDGKLQNGVAQKFQPLVVLSAEDVGIGAVREARLQKLEVVEGIADRFLSRFELARAQIFAVTHPVFRAHPR